MGWPLVTLPAAERVQDSVIAQLAGQRGSRAASSGVAIHPLPQSKKEKGGGLFRKFVRRVPHKCPPQIGCGCPVPAQPANFFLQDVHRSLPGQLSGCCVEEVRAWPREPGGEPAG